MLHEKRRKQDFLDLQTSDLRREEETHLQLLTTIINCKKVTKMSGDGPGT